MTLNKKWTPRRRTSRWASDDLAHLCRRFSRVGSCKYGTNCRFVHSLARLSSSAEEDDEVIGERKAIDEESTMEAYTIQSMKEGVPPFPRLVAHKQSASDVRWRQVGDDGKAAKLEVQQLEFEATQDRRSHAAVVLQFWWRSLMAGTSEEDAIAVVAEKALPKKKKENQKKENPNKK